MPTGSSRHRLRMNILVAPVCAFFPLLAAPAGAELTRHEAAASAQRAGGGRVLSVGEAESARGAVWRVKVVTDAGEVRVMLIDATTGLPLTRP